MTKKAYLTVDDSPTHNTDRLTDYLLEKNIPAVLFCIGGDYMDQHLSCTGIETMPDPIQRAIEKGFIIGNHTYSHKRYAEFSFEQMVEEIEKTERLIENLHKRAGIPQRVKMFRFPHLDRGCGGFVVDYEACGDEYSQILQDVFSKGVNVKMDKPTPQQIEKKEKLQEYLKKEGYTTDVFGEVTYPWFKETEAGKARDSLCTYSTSDWMLNPDFAQYNPGWEYHSLDELKQKIDEDKWLNDESSADIILCHDHNNMFEVTTSLINHLLDKGINFLEIG